MGNPKLTTLTYVVLLLLTLSWFVVQANDVIPQLSVQDVIEKDEATTTTESVIVFTSSNSTIGTILLDRDVEFTVDVIIAGDVTIEAGVNVTVCEACSIQIASTGSLTAVGTAGRPIRFISSGADPWKGIQFLAGSIFNDAGMYLSGSYLSHVHIQNADKAIMASGTVSLYLKFVTLESCSSGVYLDNLMTSRVILFDCEFIDSSFNVSGTSIKLKMLDNHFTSAGTLEIRGSDVEVDFSGNFVNYVTNIQMAGLSQAVLSDNSFKNSFSITGGDSIEARDNLFHVGDDVPLSITQAQSLDMHNNIIKETEAPCGSAVPCIRLHCVAMGTISFKNNQVNASAVGHVFSVQAETNAYFDFSSNIIHVTDASVILTWDTDSTATSIIKYNEVFVTGVLDYLFIMPSACSQITLKSNLFSIPEPNNAYMVAPEDSGYINVATNYWGTTNATVIRDKIFDVSVDPRKDYLNFSPYLSDADLTAMELSENADFVFQSGATMSGSHTIDRVMVVPLEASVIIGAGTTIHFSGSPSAIVVLGELIISGTSQEPVVVTSGAVVNGFMFKKSALLSSEDKLSGSRISNLQMVGGYVTTRTLQDGQLYIVDSHFTGTELRGNFNVEFATIVSTSGSCLRGRRNSITESTLTCKYAFFLLYNAQLIVHSSNITASTSVTIADYTYDTSTIILMSSKVHGEISIPSNNMGLQNIRLEGNEFYSNVLIDAATSTDMVLSRNVFHNSLLAMNPSRCLNDGKTILLRENEFYGVGLAVKLVASEVIPVHYGCEFFVNSNVFQNTTLNIVGQFPLRIEDNTFLQIEGAFIENVAQAPGTTTQNHTVSCSGNYWDGLDVKDLILPRILDANSDPSLDIICVIDYIRKEESRLADNYVTWDTEWTSEVSKFITRNVYVEQPLIIRENTKVFLGLGVSLFISNTLQAIGTTEEPIEFRKIDSAERFVGLTFLAEATPAVIDNDGVFQSGSTLQHVSFSGGGQVVSGQLSSTISVYTTNLYLSNIQIEDSTNGIRSTHCFSMHNSTISDASVTVEILTSTTDEICELHDNIFNNSPLIKILIATASYEGNSLVFSHNVMNGIGSWLTTVSGNSITVSDNIWDGGSSPFSSSQLNLEIKMNGVISETRFERNSITNSYWLMQFIKQTAGKYTIQNNKVTGQSNRDKLATIVNSVCDHPILVSNNTFEDQFITSDEGFLLESQCNQGIVFEFNSITGTNYGQHPIHLFVISGNGTEIRRNIFSGNSILKFFSLEESNLVVYAQENYWDNQNAVLLKNQLTASPTGNIIFQPYLASADFNSEVVVYIEIPMISSLDESTATPLSSSTHKTIESTEVQFSQQQSLLSSSLDSAVSDSSFPVEESSGIVRPLVSTSTSTEIITGSIVASSIVTSSITASSIIASSIESSLDTSASPPPSMNIHLTSNFNYCGDLTFHVSVSPLTVTNLEYTWILESTIPTRFTNTTTLPEVTIPMGQLAPSTYTMTVIVSGYLDSVPVTETSSTPFVKPANKYGNQCNHSIGFRYSFTNDRLVPRKSKIWIASSIEDARGLSYEWRVVTGNRRSAVDTSKYRVTSPYASDLALYHPDGLPEALNFTITFFLFEGTKTLFTTSFSIRTGPSVLIRPGTLEISSNNNVGLYDGVALQTRFAITARDWSTDIPDFPIRYSFFYTDEKQNQNITLFNNDNGSGVVLLPAGYGKESKLSVYLTVSSEYGDDTTIGKTLTVISERIENDILNTLSLSALGKNSTEFLSDALAITAYMNKELAAEKSKSGTSQAFKKIVSSFLQRISDLLPEDDSSSEQQIQQRIGLVALLTQTSELMTDEERKTSIVLMDHVLTRYQNISTVLEPLTAKYITEVVSNIVGAGLQNGNVSQAVTATANRLAKAIISQTVISEREFVITTENFLLATKLDRAGALSNTTVSAVTDDSGVTVSIPQQFSEQVVDDESAVISYTLLSYKNNPYIGANPSTQLNLITPVLDLTFRYENGSILAVKDLSNPLELKLSKPDRCDTTGDYSEFSCRYWNETELEWKTDGCRWVKESTTGSIVTCRCSHTTSFSAFMLNKGKCPKKAPGLSATGIVFNAIYIVLCVSIFVGLVMYRDKQPLRSRYIAPYLGISAVLVDAILQGIINNSLALGSKWPAMDGFSYVIMLTANPLSITALFVYLWQQVRFILLQHIYYLMKKKSKLSIVMYTCRLIASKLAFFVTAILIGLFVMCYFAALVAIAATRANGVQTDRTIVVQATSYAAFVIALALCIFSALIVDLVISYKSNTSETVSDSSSENSEEVMRVDQLKGISAMIAHWENDPLLFRVEACLILLVLVWIIILYPIGIASVFKDSAAKSGLSVSRFVIEILFMFTKILAFGGFVCLVTVYKVLSSPPLAMFINVNEKELRSEFTEMLKDSEGLRILSEFAAAEFSLENVYFFQELATIRADNLIMTEQERRSTVKHIYDLYIANNSERQVNCESKVRRAVERVLELETMTTVDTEDLYQKLHAAVTMNLGDTFSRLSSTKPYKAYLQAKSVHKELQTTMEITKV